MRRILTIWMIAITATLIISCGADQAMKKGDKFYAVGRRRQKSVPSKDNAH